MIKKTLTILMPIILFAGAGYAYYSLFGCNGGACAIISSPSLPMLFGGSLGFAVGLMIIQKDK